MAAPNVQLAVNADKIQVFWDLCLDGTYIAWNLYWDDEPGWPDEALALGNIPNVADDYYSDRHVTAVIPRPVSGYVPVYLRIKGVFPGGAEDTPNPSNTKYVPRLDESDPLVKQKIHGYDPDTGIWRPIFVEKDASSIAGILGFTGV